LYIPHGDRKRDAVMKKTLEQRVAALEADMRMLKEQLELAKTREGIRRGLEQVVRGKVVDAHQFLETMRKRHRLS
jgi:hypothetical protein